MRTFGQTSLNKGLADAERNSSRGGDMRGQCGVLVRWRRAACGGGSDEAGFEKGGGEGVDCGKAVGILQCRKEKGVVLRSAGHNDENSALPAGIMRGRLV